LRDISLQIVDDVSMRTTSTHWAPPAPAVFSAESFLPYVAKKPVRPAFRPMHISTDQPAYLSDRVMAKVIDIVWLAAAVAIIGAVVAVASKFNEGRIGAPSQRWTIAMGALAGAVVLYRLVDAMANRGTSVGRRHVDVRVVRAGSGHPLGLFRAALRMLVDTTMRVGPIALAALIYTTDVPSREMQVALFGFVAMNLIDLVMVARDPNRRTIPDRLAGSVVVTKAAVTSLLPFALPAR